MALRIEVAFHRGHLRRLVLKRVDAVQIADHKLKWCNDRGHPHRHREHHTRARIRRIAQQMVGADRADDECRRQIGGSHRVCEAIRKRRVEDNLEKAFRHEPAVCAEDMARRCLHPRIGGQDPERRQQRAARYQTRRHKVQVLADAVQSKQHHAEEARLEERTPSVLHNRAAGRSPRTCGQQTPTSWCRTDTTSRCPRPRPLRKR